MTLPVTYEEMKKAAEVAATVVRPKSHLAFQELVQEAWRAVLECRDSFDPTRGASFVTYATRASIYACRRASWKTVKDHAKQVLIESATEFEEPEVPDRVFDREEWRNAVRKEVRAILSEPDANPDILRLVLRNASGQEIAQERGVPSGKVFNQSWELRSRLKSSPELQRLWRNRP